jgi:hypothetical protein
LVRAGYVAPLREFLRLHEPSPHRLRQVSSTSLRAAADSRLPNFVFSTKKISFLILTRRLMFQIGTTRPNWNRKK